jgi:hypothetical protein
MLASVVALYNTAGLTSPALSERGAYEAHGGGVGGDGSLVGGYGCTSIRKSEHRLS